MKSRRRHELKENVLAQELGKLKEIFSKYGNWILVGLAAAVIVLLIVRHYTGRESARYREDKAQFEKLLTDEKIPEKDRLAGLTALAETAKDPVLAASAAIWAGDFCCERYLRALHSSDASEAQDYRRKAEDLYKMIISAHPERKLFVAKAHLGLGVLAENAGDFAAAEQQYRNVAPLVNSGYPVAQEAARRLEMRQAWSQPVEFATTLPTQPATATAPAATAPAAEKPK